MNKQHIQFLAENLHTLVHWEKQATSKVNKTGESANRYKIFPKKNENNLHLHSSKFRKKKRLWKYENKHLKKVEHFSTQNIVSMTKLLVSIMEA